MNYNIDLIRKVENMNKEDLLIKTSDCKIPEPCSDYDEETGNCKNSSKPCDTCYENSLKVFGQLTF